MPNAFGSLVDSTRPPPDEALTFLLVGTDTAEDPATGSEADGAGRSDVLMIARVDPGRTGATVVSIPRDSWVDIPGRGPNKINAAYAIGGQSLLIQTVEQLTDLRIDHVGIVDFAGFQSIVDAVGGIDVGISAATSYEGVEFRQGVNHLDGAQALAYVRQRVGLTGGDLDRSQRQQNALRAVLTDAAAGGLLSDPIRAYGFLDALTRSVNVDDSLTNGGLRALAFELVGLRPSAVTFIRAPVGGLGGEGTQSVVYLDDGRGAELWTALRQDRGGD